MPFIQGQISAPALKAESLDNIVFPDAPHPTTVSTKCSTGNLTLYSKTYHRGDQVELTKSQPT